MQIEDVRIERYFAARVVPLDAEYVSGERGVEVDAGVTGAGRGVEREREGLAVACLIDSSASGERGRTAGITL